MRSFLFGLFFVHQFCFQLRPRMKEILSVSSSVLQSDFHAFVEFKNSELNHDITRHSIKYEDASRASWVWLNMTLYIAIS